MATLFSLLHCHTLCDCKGLQWLEKPTTSKRKLATLHLCCLSISLLHTLQLVITLALPCAREEESLRSMSERTRKRQTKRLFAAKEKISFRLVCVVFFSTLLVAAVVGSFEIIRLLCGSLHFVFFFLYNIWEWVSAGVVYFSGFVLQYYCNCVLL